MLDNHNPDNPLLLLAVELISNIFCQLPSFTDAFALAATCRRMRFTWTENLGAIYAQMGPRTIPCEEYARAFRQDQVGMRFKSREISVDHLHHILRNAKMVEDTVKQFEENVVQYVRCRGLSCRTYPYGSARPPTLTRTERIRFIRAYYQLWGIMKLDLAELQPRLETIPLKQLFFVDEMAQFEFHDFRRNREPCLIYPWFPDAEPNSLHASYLRDYPGRAPLQRIIRDHLKRRYYEIHNKELDSCRLLGWNMEGYCNWVELWDHWQPIFQEVVCGTKPEPWPLQGWKTVPPSEVSDWGLVLDKLYLWYEEEHEECAGNPEITPYCERNKPQAIPGPVSDLPVRLIL